MFSNIAILYALLFFMQNKVTMSTFTQNTVKLFTKLDDYDIISALKEWENNDDFIPNSSMHRLDEL